MPIRKAGSRWKIDNVKGSFDTRKEAVKALKGVHAAKRKRRKQRRR